MGVVLSKLAKPFKNDSLAADTPILVLGADHTNIQHYGANNNGFSAMYAHFGIPHYLAINTDQIDGGYPNGNANQMSWDQIKEIRDKNSCEIVSHASRHPSHWERVNTGIAIRYLGVGTAAIVAITGTYPAITIAGTVTGGPGGEDFSFDTTNALYDNLTELVAAINAIGGGSVWSCTMAAELQNSTVKSNKLLTIPAQSAKTARRFACGGGIHVKYNGQGGSANESNDSKTAAITISGSGSMTIYRDGVQVAAYALASYTLSSLVAQINTLTGFVASICDDGGSSGDNYLSGSEDAKNLIQLSSPIECLSQPAILTAGISNWQMIDLLLQRAVDVADDNGVTLENYAQSGGSFTRNIVSGHRQHKVWRGNLDVRAVVAPLAVPSENVKRYMLQYSANIMYNRAQIEAQILALADSPGWLSCWLVHNLQYDGTTGYALNFTGYTADQIESDWYYTLSVIRGLMDQGKLNVLSMKDAANVAALNKAPPNLVFNPGFINSGESLLGKVGNGGQYIPGWLLNSDAGLSAISVENGGVIMTATGANITPLRQNIYLKPGVTYEIGLMVEILDYVSGTGVYFQLAKVRGHWEGQRVNKMTIGPSAITKTGHVKFRFTAPNRPNPKARIRSLSTVGPTFDLSVNKNIKLNIFSIGDIDNLDCSAGASNPAAVTVYEVANAINAAIKASALYRDYPEYHNIARGENGKVILEAPTYDSDATYAITVKAATASSATALIFGNANCAGHAFANMALVDDYVMWLNLGVNMVGTVKLSSPAITEIGFD